MSASAIHETILVFGKSGRILEGIVSGTPYPGTVMQRKAATEPVGGAYTYEAYNRDADGNRPAGALWVLLEPGVLDPSKLITDAYADGARCRLYCPVPGDWLLMLVSKAGTGTGDSIAIGDILIVDDGTGYLVATTGSPENEPFSAIETMSDVEADGTLTLCEFTGF
jgi:hypothetical protein